MDSVFDSLFSILPIVLGILWLLRTVNRARRKRDEKARNPVPVPAAPAEPVEQDDILDFEKAAFQENHFPTVRNAAERAADDAAEAKAKAAARVAARASQVVRAAEVARAEQVEKAARAKRTILAASQSSSYDAGNAGGLSTSKLQSGTGSISENTAAARETNGESVLSRIASLSPLAQGILWASILEKPPGIQDPTDW